MSKKAKVEVISDGTDIFVVVDGLKIAKRGHPDTSHAKTWVPLEPGWDVVDGENLETIAIRYNGVAVH
jgi:hypothetical protein